MQSQDIVSPTYSVSSNALKLNSSSIASSTPGCEHLQGPLVPFQQFSQTLNNQPFNRFSQPKKRLTIQIDSDYDFQQQQEQLVQQPSRLNLMIPTPQSSTGEGRKESMDNIVEKYEQQMETWRHYLQASELGRRELQRQNQQLRLGLKKKQQALGQQIDVNSQLMHKLAQYQEMQAQDRFYDEKMREKESKYKELQKVHEKVVTMNKCLQRDLRESDKKVMELQKELQKSVCTTQHENLAKIRQTSSKLKESSLKLTNKENTLVNTVKSVQRKKGICSQSQIKKTGRVSSSTTNIAKKLQIKTSLI